MSLIHPDTLIITCYNNTAEVDPNDIVLRLNGDVTDVANVSIIEGEGKNFSINSLLLPNQVVAQCTSSPMLGSLPAIIPIRERGTF